MVIQLKTRSECTRPPPGPAPHSSFGAGRAVGVESSDSMGHLEKRYLWFEELNLAFYSDYLENIIGLRFRNTLLHLLRKNILTVRSMHKFKEYLWIGFGPPLSKNTTFKQIAHI